ncbi:hypothetical protein COT48_03865 [Candidatus Woesearchaeota archaeon CG08_land_8_20_14_0_20_47_9]|nr:MAG: hypothetical protein COT48_03865 [Candidatus Woesearchaeota archaeon CG08_land_8_20_14_0_20_47_9]
MLSKLVKYTLFVRKIQPSTAADGHFASQNVLLATPKGATPAEPAPWLDFSFECVYSNSTKPGSNLYK